MTNKKNKSPKRKGRKTVVNDDKSSETRKKTSEDIQDIKPCKIDDTHENVSNNEHRDSWIYSLIPNIKRIIKRTTACLLSICKFPLKVVVWFFTSWLYTVNSIDWLLGLNDIGIDSEEKETATSDKQRIKTLRKREKEFKQKIEILQKSKNEAEKRLSDKQNELEALKRDKTNLETIIRENEKKLKTLWKGKEDAMNRLSELMGAKLCDNNPAITNLNDPNRPMKLCDQFSELYENEWTDAYQEMIDSKHLQLTEEKTISALINILKEINDTCLNFVAEKIEKHKALVKDFSGDEIESYVKSVKELILKTHAAQFIPLVCKKISSNGSTCAFVSKYKKYCHHYFEKCVRICYFAALQHPPMFLDFEPGKLYDKTAYKEYTKSGKQVDFLVWPALHLHNGGPVLCKGVVQPQE